MEQQLQKFMIQQFQPSGVSFRDGYENISEHLGPYFMPISVGVGVGAGVGVAPVVASSETTLFRPIPSVPMKDIIIPLNSLRGLPNEDESVGADSNLRRSKIPITIKHENKPQTLHEKARGNGNKPLDQYWAFWAAYISIHGMKAYENIPEKERFRFRLEQKAKASEWMVEDFKRTKTILAPHWYRLTNRDMEDMATSLMTNADESKEGLDCMVMMWNYYLHCGIGGCGVSGGRGVGIGGVGDGVSGISVGSREGSGKSASELYWVHPAKKVFYKLSMTNLDIVEKETASETIPNPGAVWGVFVKEKAGGKHFSYELRRMERGEEEKMEIENNSIRLSFVDKPLMAVSKYTLKELMDMGDIFGVRPPPSEKKSGNLDMENLVFEAEKNLGVIRKKPSVVKATEEKWKKGVWYENLEMYLSEIF